MAISISTVTNSIAALSVSGVTIKDIDEIPSSVIGRDCPILYPEPDGFIANFTVTPMAFGTAGSGPFDVEYDLVYAFLYCPVGTGRSLLDVYDEMVTKAVLIYDRIIVSDAITGAVELTAGDVMQFGAVPDPAGNMFLGTRMVFHVKEFE